MKHLKLLFLLLSLSACVEKPADIKNRLQYKNDGISFFYPGNWEVTEDTVVEAVRFIFIETPGDAIMKIEIYPIDQSFELKEFVELDIEALINRTPEILNLAKDNEIAEVKTSIRGIEYSGLKYELGISILGVDIPHVSEFYALHSNDNVAYLVSQVAKDDLRRVNVGFKLVLSSFKMNR